MDVEGRREETRVGQNHAEAEAAMANSDEKKRGPRALVGEEAWGEAGEVRRDTGMPYIAEGRLLELTGELQLANNGGQSRFVARACHLRLINGETR